MQPETLYAKSGDLSIAYQHFGDGQHDVLLAPGFISHLELGWEEPSLRRALERLGSFGRVITFDKRGTGLSDPTPTLPTLEDHTMDLQAVMDAAGVEKATLLGFSEGGTMAAMLAATHPERTSSLVLCGAWARLSKAPDYPIGIDIEKLRKMVKLVDRWGTGVGLSAWAPSRRDDTHLRAWWGRLQRLGASPAMARSLFATYPLLDTRRVLGAITTPTLVLHRRDDLMVPVALGRYVAEHIEGARLVELDGQDHLWFVGDTDALLDEIEAFVTGAPPGPSPDRVLLTVLFADVVGSTEKAAEMGDKRWADLLETFQETVRSSLDRYGGRLMSFAGDGFFATFDGPAAAIRGADAIRDSVHSLGLHLRTGVHTGEVEVLGSEFGGIGVHLGARVMAEAEPDEILVSSTVRDLVVGSSIDFEPRGMHELKGIPGEWQLLAVSRAA
jgi:pimeloyl-ACP methyl ester carboxylesterase